MPSFQAAGRSATCIASSTSACVQGGPSDVHSRGAPAFGTTRMDAERVPYWIKQYGNDTMFLVGSSLYAQRDLRAATARLVDSIRRSSDG